MPRTNEPGVARPRAIHLLGAFTFWGRVTFVAFCCARWSPRPWRNEAVGNQFDRSVEFIFPAGGFEKISYSAP